LSNYSLPGVVWLMIGLVAVQIVAVYVWGVEPARRSLEGLDPQASGADAKPQARVISA
jgi:putative MFS transporter